jgi:hypothetical protein
MTSLCQGQGVRSKGIGLKNLTASAAVGVMHLADFLWPIHVPKIRDHVASEASGKQGRC